MKCKQESEKKGNQSQKRKKRRMGPFQARGFEIVGCLLLLPRTMAMDIFSQERSKVPRPCTRYLTRFRNRGHGILDGRSISDRFVCQIIICWFVNHTIRNPRCKKGFVSRKSATALIFGTTRTESTPIGLHLLA